MNPVELSSITIHGRPVKKLYPGWKALRRYKVTSELDVIHLKELESGKDAFWWLDKDGAYLASHAAALPHEQKDRLIAYIAPAVTQLQMNMQLIDPVALPAKEEEIRSVLATLPYQAAFEIMMIWYSARLSRTMIFSPQSIINVNIKLDGDEIITLSQKALLQIIKAPFDSEETLQILSPFSSQLISGQVKAEMPGGPFIRFFDPCAKVIFYLFWHARNGRKAMSPGNMAVTFYYPRGCFLVGDCPISDLIPLWLMFFFLFYNNELTNLQLDAPSTVGDELQAQTPRTFSFYDFNADPRALIPLDDLREGKISNMNDMMDDGKFDPIDFVFEGDASFPFSPISKNRG